MRFGRNIVGIAAGVLAAACLVPAGGEGRAAESGAGSPFAPDDSALVALGRRLFHDPTVSRTGKHSCGSCHDPEHGWSDARKVPVDFDGPMLRHSQPVTDLAGKGFHWDGEFDAPADLVKARIGDVDPLVVATRSGKLRVRGPGSGGTAEGSYGGGSVAGMPGMPAALMHRAMEPLAIADRLASDDRYAPAFRAAFGDAKVDAKRVTEAVDAFVLSLKTRPNAVDRRLAGEETALGASAERGLDLFRGKAACSSCHALDLGDDGRAALTDHAFHNTGISFAEKEKVEPPAQAAGVILAERPDGPDAGRSGRTDDPSLTGAFKTPSLRDVARRAPYMHDGSLATLEDVVRYYAKGGTPNEHLDPKIQPRPLDDGEVRDLVAFLESLSGPARAGLQRERKAFHRVKVTVALPTGEPAADLPVQVVPYGERLGAGPAVAEMRPLSLRTSASGELEFEFPQSTHVLLTSPAHELAGGRPVPDCAGELAVTAAPSDRIWVVLRGANLPETMAGTPVDPRDNVSLLLPGQAGLLSLPVPQDTPIGQGPRLPRERYEFTKVASPKVGEALYSAPRGGARVRAMVRFDLDGGTLMAPVDLDGGWSEPAALRRLVSGSSTRTR